VGVPVYACVTVFEAVAAAGLRCVFVDLAPDTFGYDFDSLGRHRDEMAAAVVVHTFGFPGDVPAVGDILGGRPVIEDCAQALGTRRGGRSVGLEGVASIFSFNYHKPVSAGGGGLLAANDPAVAARARDLLAGAPTARAGVAGALKRIATATLYRRPWYGLMTASGLVKLRRDGALGAHVDVELMAGLDEALTRIGLDRMQARLTRRRAWARQLADALPGRMPLGRFAEIGDDWNAYLAPVLLPSHADREAALDAFHARGVDAFILWPECLRTAARFGCQAGQCPRLADALERLLILPCYAELTRRRRERILRAVGEVLAPARAGPPKT